MKSVTTTTAAATNTKSKLFETVRSTRSLTSSVQKCVYVYAYIFSTVNITMFWSPPRLCLHHVTKLLPLGYVVLHYILR